jgi:hypothetical protein
MKFKVVTFDQFSSPGIVNYYRGSKLRSLHHRFDLASVLRTPAGALC